MLNEKDWSANYLFSLDKFSSTMNLLTEDNDLFNQ